MTALMLPGLWLGLLLALQESAERLVFPGASGITTLDVEGDGVLEFLVSKPGRLEVSRAGSVPLFHLDTSGSRTVACCVAPVATLDADAKGRKRSRDAVFLLRDGGVVQRWEPGKDAVEIARDPAVALPAGDFWFEFARDLDGDGRADLALPELRGLALWFANADGTLRRGPTVHQRVKASLDLPDPDALATSAAESLTIPAFTVEDMNGDGRPDLAFTSDDRVQFFWSDAKGGLREQPALDLDLAELRAKQKRAEVGGLDPTNLFKVLEQQVTADTRDLDGDGFADLLLRQGAKVVLFAGTQDGIERAKAAQVLKTSGNLLGAFAADDNGDGKLDLCMLQVADVSIGEVLLWIVAGGKLRFDLFTYWQEEKLHFARSPSKRRRLVIDVPALLGIADEFEDNPALKQLGEQMSSLPVELDLDGDGRRDDVAELEKDGTIELFEGAAPPPEREGDDATWRSVIERFDRLVGDQDEVTIELLGVADWIPVPNGRIRGALAGKAPTKVLVPKALPDPITPNELNGPDGEKKLAEFAASMDRSFVPMALVVLDLDGDGKDDLIVTGSEGDGLALDVYRTK